MTWMMKAGFFESKDKRLIYIRVRPGKKKEERTGMHFIVIQNGEITISFRPILRINPKKITFYIVKI